MIGAVAARDAVQFAWQMLVLGTALALLTAFLCAAAGRRFPPAVHVALWSVALLRFLVPPVLPGDATLIGLLVDPAASAAVPAAVSPPASAGGSISGPSASDPKKTVSPDSVPSHPARGGPTASQLLLLGYFAALLLVLSRSAIGWGRLRRRLRCLPPAPRELAEEVASLSRRIGLRRVPKALVSPENWSPFVTGIVRPRLVFPKPLLDRTGPSAREPLLLHELAHLRRRDPLLRALQNLARLLFFFWPPVRWICRRIERASEVACDDWALALSPVAPRAYARSLLEIIRLREQLVSGNQAMALARPGQILQERFEMILKEPRSRKVPRVSGLALVALLAWSAFSLGGGSAAEQKTRAEKSPAARGGRVLRIRTAGPGHVFSPRWSALLVLEPSADLDRDGRITNAEARGFAEARPGAERDRVLALHPEADADGDGRLGTEELYRLFDRVLHAPAALFAPRVSGARLDEDSVAAAPLPAPTFEYEIVGPAPALAPGAPAPEVDTLPSVAPEHDFLLPAPTGVDGEERIRGLAPLLPGFEGAMPEPFNMVVNPEEADTNRDGKITEEEAEAYLDQKPSHPVLFEWIEEEGDGRPVRKKIIRWVPEPLPRD